MECLPRDQDARSWCVEPFRPQQPQKILQGHEFLLLHTYAWGWVGGCKSIDPAEKLVGPHVLFAQGLALLRPTNGTAHAAGPASASEPPRTL